jgi:spermidine synthase
VFAGVVFLGALLAFQVQFLLGKHLLPRYGGASAVWTTCLLFFQAALLAGYAWAHLLDSGLSPRRQRDAHLALLGTALALLAGRAATWPSPITPAGTGAPPPPGAPILSILSVLASTIGLPFVVLAATSPLLQAQLARRRPGASPVRLFAVSNAGSLAGLASYPLAVEPLLPLRAQGWLWSALFAVYAAGLAFVMSSRGAPVAPGAEGSAVSAPADPSDPAPWKAGPLPIWIALAAFPSLMLAAVTSHLTQEVAPVPLLWMLPLALYLLSFVLSFAWPDAGRAPWRIALAGAASLSLFGLHSALVLRVPARVALWSVILFLYGMAGHGELAARRPEPCRLTTFYLAIAAGGALGGLVAAVVAPLAFAGYWELPLGILAGPLSVWAACLRDAPAAEEPTSLRDRPALRISPRPTRPGRVGMTGVALGLVALAVGLVLHVAGEGEAVVCASRGFYGVLRVVRGEAGEPDETLRLLHGRIGHGLQFVAPARRAELTTYYGPSSGAGLAIRRHPKYLAGQPMRVGVIGLGVGTLAAWSRPGDVFRFYELDPEVLRLSEGENPVFTFLRDARGGVEVRLGDGRLALESEAPQGFDVLVVDAFSSDAVPTHLLTLEAFAACRRHLAPGGAVALQVTNRYLDLKPVVRGAAAALGLRAAHVPSSERGALWSSDWMIVAEGPTLLDDEVVSAATLPRGEGDRQVLWTDDWSDPFRVLKP